MKTMKKDKTIKRISEEMVETFKRNGYIFCPKSEYKKIREWKKTRDVLDSITI